jgi:hypothetical protein
MIARKRVEMGRNGHRFSSACRFNSSRPMMSFCTSVAPS